MKKIFKFIVLFSIYFSINIFYCNEISGESSVDEKVDYYRYKLLKKELIRKKCDEIKSIHPEDSKVIYKIYKYLIKPSYNPQILYNKAIKMVFHRSVLMGFGISLPFSAASF